MVPSPDYRLRFLGGASIEGPEGPLTGRAAQRNALALMAVLVTASHRTLPRETITSLLWPERETKRARHLLNVTAYEIRKALGKEALATANGGLRLSPEVVGSDVEAFGAAVEAGAWDRAEGLFAGAFLDGFHYDGSEPFERWVERERWRCERLYRTVLERLAEAEEEPTEAVERWRALLERDPASATATLGLMRMLEVTGKRAEAIDTAHTHRMLLLDEYGADPNPDVEALADRLREAPVGNGGVDLEPSGATTGQLPLHRRKPDRRLSAVLGAVALAFLAFIYVGFGSDERPEPGEAAIRRVLVAPLANETGDSTLARLGLLAADFISQELRATGLVAVLSPAATRRDYGGESEKPATDVDMARASRADILVSGAFYRRGDSLVFQTRIIDPETGEIARAVREVSGPVGDPTAAVDPLRRQVTGALTTYVDSRLAAWSAGASQPPSFEAYQVFADGLDLFFREEWTNAGERLRRAAEIDSSFTTPLVWAMYAYSNRAQPERVDSIARRLDSIRDRLDPWDRAQLDYRLAETSRARYDAMQRVVQVAPDSEWRYTLAITAISMRRPAEAYETLTGLDPELGWLKEWPYYWRFRTRALHLLGDHERELQDARRARRQYPEMEWLEGLEFVALIGLGRVEEVLERIDRPVVTTAQELFAHGYTEIGEEVVGTALARIDSLPTEKREDLQWRYWRGQLLILAERWAEGRAVFEGMLEEDPGVAVLHAYLGVAAAGMGDEAYAREQLERVRDLTDTGYGLQAGILAHLGETREALDLLKRVVERHFGADIHRDPLYRPLWNDPEFRELLRPLG